MAYPGEPPLCRREPLAPFLPGARQVAYPPVLGHDGGPDCRAGRPDLASHAAGRTACPGLRGPGPLRQARRPGGRAETADPFSFSSPRHSPARSSGCATPTVGLAAGRLPSPTRSWGPRATGPFAKYRPTGLMRGDASARDMPGSAMGSVDAVRAQRAISAAPSSRCCQIPGTRVKIAAPQLMAGSDLLSCRAGRARSGGI
jgi:hypothetical protein